MTGALLDYAKFLERTTLCLGIFDSGYIKSLRHLRGLAIILFDLRIGRVMFSTSRTSTSRRRPPRGEGWAEPVNPFLSVYRWGISAL